MHRLSSSASSPLRDLCAVSNILLSVLETRPPPCAESSLAKALGLAEVRDPPTPRGWPQRLAIAARVRRASPVLHNVRWRARALCVVDYSKIEIAASAPHTTHSDSPDAPPAGGGARLRRGDRSQRSMPLHNRNSTAPRSAPSYGDTNWYTRKAADARALGEWGSGGAAPPCRRVPSW